ncbi:T9SS type A sorting domain-containing protein [Flavobacterium sp. Sd200]|uniref:T9SS type A sorting domain-containing protein n=1 Tax=Flavobacterium sp. Sd200 TaxID=2692211 RepID=UPI0013700033|nr:T9SS type A sorting domain-containing protein [Flavobacterium sp. Sd200]MXN90604.1 T9SS type A sorting domain-containing protein [Flavobacterium sp. Sd200]
MKKITLLSIMLFSGWVNAQTSFAIYTEDPTVGEGATAVRFNNGQGFAGSEPTTAPYEGTKNYLFTFNGTSSYYHAILFPRNAANTSDVTVDFSAYAYYNVAIKTSSAAPFYVRMRGNGITSKVLIDPTSNPYGFSNNNEWHFMSIPFADFIPESAAFSLATITEAFVLRSNLPNGSVAGLPNDFEIDNIYVSVNQVMNTQNFAKKSSLSIYPNPSAGSITISSHESINNVFIHNLLGQQVMALNPKSNSAMVDISSLQNGVYTITAESNGQQITSRLVKQ